MEERRRGGADGEAAAGVEGSDEGEGEEDIVCEGGCAAHPLWIGHECGDRVCRLR